VCQFKHQGKVYGSINLGKTSQIANVGEKEPPDPKEEDGMKIS
jgi:hypothetical protein